jgi:ribose transport system substrate-binding protein
MRTATIRVLLPVLALVAAASGGATTAAEGDTTTSPVAEATDTTAPTATAEAPDTTTATDATATAGEAPSLEFTGPNGETPTPSSELELTDEEIRQVTEGGYTAALVWHENSAFIQAVEEGVREKFDELGIEVIASTSAEFDAAQQAANIETVLANDPDIIVTIAVDPTTAAQAFRPAVEQGVEIVVLTTPPAGYTAGEEIVGIVTGELTAYGKAAAEMLGEALGGAGEVGWIFHDADFWFTNQRDQAFKDWLAYLYPNMEVVDEAGFSDPARTEDIANAMITRNPELTGIYVAWATAADGVLAALRAAGRDDVRIVTNDLDQNLALDMVQGGNVVGVVANPAVDTGRSLGIMAAYGVLGKEAPEMAVAAPVATTSENLAEGWQAEFAEDPPQELIDAAGG